MLALSGLLFPSIMAQAMDGGGNHMNGSGQSHVMTNIENMTMNNTQSSTFKGHAVENQARNFGDIRGDNSIRKSGYHNYSQDKGGALGLSNIQRVPPKYNLMVELIFIMRK